MNRIQIAGFEFPDPNEFEDVGIKSTLELKCHYVVDSFTIKEKLADCIVSDSAGGGKTYVLVFEGGGTCEFDVTEHGYVELMDSHGIDFSWAGNGHILISPHRPSTAIGSRSFWGRTNEGIGDQENR